MNINLATNTDLAGIRIPDSKLAHEATELVRDTRRCVQGDGRPDRVDIVLRDAAASQEVTGDIRTVDLKALPLAAVLMGQAHVVEHRACIKQFRIEFESAAPACQSAPVIDAARMVKQQRRFAVPHQFRDFARQLAVGDPDSRKIGILGKIDSHRTFSHLLRGLPIT